jgi:hypothetical protein
MKAARLIALLTIAAACMAQAETNIVSSANVVGYNQITIPSNQYVLVALDFNNASNTIDGLFGNLPAASIIYRWDTGSQTYQTCSKSRSGVWLSGANNVGTNRITIGTGAFVQLPPNVQTNIYLSGDVPTAGTTSVYKVNGYAIIAYPYPADIAFTNTALAKNAANGDIVSIWNKTNWLTASKNRAGGWDGGASTSIIKVGEAFFFNAKTNSTINEVKPYTL